MFANSQSDIDPRRYTVMVLDKDPTLRATLRATLRRSLEEEGFLVLDLDNERRALELSRKVSVDLLVTALFLPARSAREVANRISMHHLKLKVLFVSDYAKDVVISHGMAPAGSEVIQKPVFRRQLIEGVYASLASSACWRQIAQGGRDFSRIGGDSASLAEADG